MIDILYDCYKNLENINVEIENLTIAYLNNFLESSQTKSFQDTLEFHRKLFITCIYKDSYIHNFIIFLFKFFYSSNFNNEKYQDAQFKLNEIYVNLELNQRDESKSLEEVSEQEK